MITQQPKWTQAEFLSYLLLYAAHADAQFNEEEKAHIRAKVAEPVYEKIWQEFSSDNDYRSLQKILKHHKSDPSITAESILQEIQELFLADHYFHRMEKYALKNIQRLLN